MPEQPESQAHPDPQSKPANRGAWISGAIVLCVAVAVIYFVIDASNKEQRSKAATEAALRDDLASSADSLAAVKAEGAKLEAEGAALKAGTDPSLAISDAQQNLKNGEYQSALARLGKLSQNDRKRPDVRSLIDKAARETRKDRTDYAREYEEERLKEGEDYTVKATGSDNTTLNITYALMCRPLVYKLQNDIDLIHKWRNLGFEKVHLSDGYNSSWTLIPYF